MKDYIDRAALYEVMNGQDCEFSLIDALELIERFPAADVVSVRHGYWIHDINNQYGCSECMGKETMSHKNLKPYCPNCGARMDKEAVHET